MIPYVKAFDIVGYTYQADNLCEGCLWHALAPADEYHGGVESFLDALATARGIDRYDERTFDSGDFPKVIFASMIESDERCGSCGGEL